MAALKIALNFPQHKVITLYPLSTRLHFATFRLEAAAPTEVFTLA